jgi:hypothetical protein
MWRELTTARGGLSAKPKAKGAKGASQERQLTVAAAEEWERAYSGGGWPRPKADVALDIWAVTDRNAPQLLSAGPLGAAVLIHLMNQPCSSPHWPQPLESGWENIRTHICESYQHTPGIRNRLGHHILSDMRQFAGKAAYSTPSYSSAGERWAAMTPLIRCVAGEWLIESMPEGERAPAKLVVINYLAGAMNSRKPEPTSSDP